MGGRTQTRFPQQNGRFPGGDKRPGSAQMRKNMRSQKRKMWENKLWAKEGAQRPKSLAGLKKQELLA